MNFLASLNAVWITVFIWVSKLSICYTPAFKKLKSPPILDY